MPEQRSSDAQDPLAPSRVRYIKLGQAGGWEAECLDQGIIRMGFGSAEADRFSLCRASRWRDVAEAIRAEGKSQGTATRCANELRVFFEDDGNILWITFSGDRLYWAFCKATPPEPHGDGNGVWRPVTGSGVIASCVGMRRRTRT